VSLAWEVNVKGGFDSPLAPADAQALQEEKAGMAMQHSGIKVQKDYDPYQDRLSIQQVIPMNGYMPVHLVNRGLSILERSFKQKRPMLTPS